MASWSPTRHWLHHARFRDAIRTVLLVSERLFREHDEAASSEEPPATHSELQLRVLPPEIWLCVCSWLLRRHFAAYLAADRPAVLPLNTPGVRVAVVGLVATPEYNGRRGTVQGCKASKRGRLVVVLDRDDQPMLIRVGNVQRIADPEV